MDADSSYGGSDTAPDSTSGGPDGSNSIETTTPDYHHQRRDSNSTDDKKTLPITNMDDQKKYYHKNEVTLPVNDYDATDHLANHMDGKETKGSNLLPNQYRSVANLNITETLEHHNNLDEMNKKYNSNSYLNANASPKNRRKSTSSGLDNPGFEGDTNTNPTNSTTNKSVNGKGPMDATRNGDLNNSFDLGLKSPNSSGTTTKNDEPMAEAVNLELINLKPNGKDVTGPYENGTTGIPIKKETEVEMGNPYDEYFVPVNEHRKYISSTRKGRSSVTFAETLVMGGGTTCGTTGIDGAGYSVNTPEHGVLEYPDWLTSCDDKRGEKLYVTMDKRNTKKRNKCLCWGICIAIVAAVVIVGILAATGVIGNNNDAQPVQEVTSRKFNDSPAKQNDLKGAGILYGVSKEGSTTTSVTYPPTPGPSISTLPARITTDTSMIQVPRAIESQFKIDNLQYTPEYGMKNSSEFKELASILEKNLKNTFFTQDMLNYGPANIAVKVIGFEPGSVIVKYRIGWNFKNGNHEAEDPINKKSAHNKMVHMLQRNRSYINQYYISMDSLEADNIIDMCQIQKNGCQHDCMFDYQVMDFQCTCEIGMVLSADGRTCKQDLPHAESEPEPEPTAEPEPEPAPEPHPTSKPEPEPSAEPELEPTTESKPEPVPVTEHSQHYEYIPVTTIPLESKPEPEPTAEPTFHAVTDHVFFRTIPPLYHQTSTPEPEPAAEPEPTAEPTAEPAAEAEPEPTSEPEPAAEPEPTTAPSSEPEPAAEPEPTSEPEPTQTQESEGHLHIVGLETTTTTTKKYEELNVAPTAEPDAEPEPTTKAEPEPTTEAEPEPTAEPEPAVQPESAAQPEPEPTAEPEPAIEPEPEPTAEPQPAAEQEPTTEPEPSPSVDTTIEPEPKSELEPTAEPEPSSTEHSNIEVLTLRDTIVTTTQSQRQSKVDDVTVQESTTMSHSPPSSIEPMKGKSTSSDYVHDVIKSESVFVTLPPELRSTTLGHSSTYMTKVFTELHKVLDGNESRTEAIGTRTTIETHQALISTEPTEPTNHDEMSPFLPHPEDILDHNIYNEFVNDTDNYEHEISRNPQRLDNDEKNVTNPIETNPEHIITNVGSLTDKTTTTPLPPEFINNIHSSPVFEKILEGSTERNLVMTTMKHSQFGGFTDRSASTEDLIAMETTTNGLHKLSAKEEGSTNIVPVIEELNHEIVHAEIVETATSNVFFSEDTTINDIISNPITTQKAHQYEVSEVSSEPTTETTLLLKTTERAPTTTSSNDLLEQNKFNDPILSVVPLPSEPEENKKEQKRIAADDSDNTLTSFYEDSDLNDINDGETHAVIDKFTKPIFDHTTKDAATYPITTIKYNEFAEDNNFGLEDKSGEKVIANKKIYDKKEFFDKKSKLNKALIDKEEDLIISTLGEKPVTEGYTLSGVFNRCNVGQFACANGTALWDGSYCVPKSSRCDSIDDCSDASDEMDCQDCVDNFKCNNGVCLRRDLVCDGITNCLDGSDEENCNDWKCREDEFACNSRDKKCMPSIWKCDGKRHCSNGKDEANCHLSSSSCTADEFYCHDQHACIPITWRCDGHNDCKNHDDERRCVCDSKKFMCSLSGQCIDQEYRCDGEPQCADESDELQCFKLDRYNEHKNAFIVNVIDDLIYQPVCKENWTKAHSDNVCNRNGYTGATSFESVKSAQVENATAYYLLRGASGDLYLPHMEKTETKCDEVVAVTCIEFSCGSYQTELPPTDTTTGRIIGGTGSPTSQQWPSLALLHNSKTNVKCTATIISPVWAAMSYACLDSGRHTGQSEAMRMKRYWTLQAGGVTYFGDKEEPTKQKVNVLRVVEHPQAKFKRFEYTNDIVLVQLETPLRFSDHVNAVCLSDAEVTEEDICVTAGFGITKLGETALETRLNYLPVPHIPMEECNSTIHYNKQLSSDKICAGFTDNLKTPCYNDEGAPLMCFSHNEASWKLKGLLSHHANCGRTGHPAVYTAIRGPVLSWIKNVIGKAST